MRWLITAVGLLMSGPALAVNVRDWSPYAKALLDHMAITFLCRAEIGDAHYAAAKTVARDSLAPYIGQEAPIMVEGFDRRFKADKRAVRVSAAECYRLKSEAVQKIEAEKAKLEAE